VFYDKGNRYWRKRLTWGPNVTAGEEAEAVVLDRWPHLRGHDYQAIAYFLPFRKGDLIFTGPLYILVGRNTGEVLLAHRFPE
jgi:hypothetical protein